VLIESNARPEKTAERSHTKGLVWWWAVVGVVLIFSRSVLVLGTRGIMTMRAGLTAAEWLALAVLTAVFVYTEGVRALQRKYVPHVLRRVDQVRSERRLVYRVLAPLYSLSLIGGTRRTLVRAWLGLAAIVAAVLIVRSFAEPWRGIVDFAVAAALAWGTISIVRGALRGDRTRDPKTATAM
jgi:hypothetical protein